MPSHVGNSTELPPLHLGDRSSERGHHLGRGVALGVASAQLGTTRYSVGVASALASAQAAAMHLGTDETSGYRRGRHLGTDET